MRIGSRWPRPTISTAGATPRALAEAGVPADGSSGRSTAGAATCSATEPRRAPAGAELRSAARVRRPGQERDLPFAIPSASPCSTRCCSSCAPIATRWTTAPTRWFDRLAAPRQGRPPRHPQDARLRPLPRSRGRRTASSPGSSPSIISCAPTRVLRAPFRQHALVDPDARARIHWDGETLSEGPGAVRRTRPAATRSRRCGRPITRRSSIRRG